MNRMTLLGAGGGVVAGGGVTPAIFRAVDGNNVLAASGSWSIAATGASAGDGLFISVMLYHTDTAPVFTFPGGGTATLLDTTTWTTSGDGTIKVATYAYVLQGGATPDVVSGSIAATYTQATSSGKSAAVSAIYTGPTTLTRENFGNSALSATSVSITGYTPGGTSRGALAFISQRINGGNNTAATPPAGWTMRLNNAATSTPGVAAVFFSTISDDLTTVSNTSYTWTTWATTAYETIAGIIWDMH